MSLLRINREWEESLYGAGEPAAPIGQTLVAWGLGAALLFIIVVAALKHVYAPGL